MQRRKITSGTQVTKLLYNSIAQGKRTLISGNLQGTMVVSVDDGSLHVRFVNHELFDTIFQI